jgi:hypothetical protein
MLCNNRPIEREANPVIDDPRGGGGQRARYGMVRHGRSRA